VAMHQPAVSTADHNGSDLGIWEEFLPLFAWLARQLRAAERPLGLFLHKPLFVADPDEATIDTACLPPGPRHRLLRLLDGSAVRFVACGHVHQSRVTEWRGITIVWGPSTAFPATSLLPGATGELGWVVHRLCGVHHEVVVVRDERLQRHDLDELKGHGRSPFLYQTPPTPLPAERNGAVTCRRIPLLFSPRSPRPPDPDTWLS
jgi:hypothetical protein